MGESGTCPTEDAIKALLEYLVDPTLPAKSSVRDTPSLSQQQLVAKQMHAAVLLYNYYLRKQHPQLEVLGFEAFCKLAVVLRPPLLAHLRLMQRSDDTELDDLEKQLSETEKRVMEACDISTSLDASKDVPNIEGWPISKVAVLLVDSKRENFILRFSSITEGVWSLIEKDVDISNITSEGVVDAKQANRKKRFIRKPSKDESSVDESSLLQLSYLAVKESTGINQTDLLVLERHAVYSLSKEKTATRFYIMQCTKSVHDHEDVIQVPIKDTIDSSLQGPLVRKSSIKWMVTSAVEYFHLFPYAGIVSTWFSRKVSSDSLQDLRVGDGNLNVNSQEWTEKPWTPEIHKSQDSSHIGDGLVGGFGNNTKSANTESLKLKDNNGSYMIGLSGSLTGSQNTKSANTESPKQKDDNGGCMIGLSGSLTGTQNRKSTNTESPMQKDNNGGCMIGLSGSLTGPQSTKSANTELLKQKDNGRCMIVLSGSHTGPQNGIVDESFMVPSQNGEKWKNIADTIQADNQQEKMTNCVEGDLNGSPCNLKVKDEMLGLMTSPCITESRGKQIAPVNQTCDNILSVQGGGGNHALVAYQSNPIDLDRLQNTIAPMQNELSNAALRVLLRKRDQLSLQQRNIEDEIALCDKKIQKILNGGEDDLALKIESIIEGCNDVCLRSITQERTCQQLDDQCLPQNFKRKRFSEAVFSMQNPCQELDSVCNENNWILPTYCVFSSDGGFRAGVTVRGVDFECSSGGDMRSNPREARELAAAQMLAKLRTMTSSTQ